MKKVILETIGWYGALAIFLAYVLVSYGVVQPDTYTYQILNLTGGIGIVVVSFWKKNYQPGVLNIIWSVIAASAIIMLLV